MRKLALVSCLIMFSGISLGLEAEMTSPGPEESILFDRTEDTEKFYGSTPLTQQQVGSLTYADSSLRSPDVKFRFTGPELEGKKVMIFYSSLSGNLTLPVLEKAAYINSSGPKTLDLETSGFLSLFPGRLAAGYVNRSDEYEPENVTKVEKGLMDGNFSVRAEKISGKQATRLTVRHATGDRGRRIPDRPGEVLVSVKDGGGIFTEYTASLGETQTLDLVFDGDEEVYVNSILALRPRVIESCRKLTGDSRYYLLNRSLFNVDPSESGPEDSCIRIEDSRKTVFDFAGHTIDGDENLSEPGQCGIKVLNSSQTLVKTPKLTDFQRGICDIRSQGTRFHEGFSVSNEVGAYVSESGDTEIEGTELRNSETEVNSKESSTEVKQVYVQNANISSRIENLSIRRVSEPSVPGNREVIQWFRAVGEGNMALENLSFNLNNSLQGPEVLQIDGDSRSGTQVSVTEDRIEVEERFTDTSTFALTRQVQGQPPEQGDGGSGGGGGGGSGGGSGGGGGGALPEPPEEGEPDLILDTPDNSLRVQQGITFEINVSVTNTGEGASNSTVINQSLPEEWDGETNQVPGLEPGESFSTDKLVEVYQDQKPGKYTITLELGNESDPRDTEEVSVLVLPRQSNAPVKDVRVVESLADSSGSLEILSPSRIRMPVDSSTRIQYLIRNTGNVDLGNVTAVPQRLDKCLKSVEGGTDINAGETETLELTLESRRNPALCPGSMKFVSDGEVLGIEKLTVRVIQDDPDGRFYILPLLVLIWTIFTAYRVRGERNGRRY